MRFNRAPGDRTSDLPTFSKAKDVVIKQRIGSEKTQIDTQDVLNKVRMQQIGNDGDVIHNATELSYRKSINMSSANPIDEFRLRQDQLEPTTRAQPKSMSVDISAKREFAPAIRKFASKNTRKQKNGIGKQVAPHFELEIAPQIEMNNSERGDARPQLHSEVTLANVDVHVDPRGMKVAASSRAMQSANVHVESHPELDVAQRFQPVAVQRPPLTTQVKVGFDLQVVHPFSREGRLKLNRKVSEFYSQTGRHMTHEELVIAMTHQEPKEIRRQVEVRERPEADMPEVTKFKATSESKTKRAPTKVKPRRVEEVQELPVNPKEVIKIPRDADSLGVDTPKKLMSRAMDTMDLPERGLVQTPAVEHIRTRTIPNKNIMTPAELSSDPRIREQAMKEKSRAPAKVKSNLNAPELSAEPKIGEQAAKEQRRLPARGKKNLNAPSEEVAVRGNKPAKKSSGKTKIKAKASRAEAQMPEVQFSLFDPLQKAAEEKMSKAKMAPHAAPAILSVEIQAPEVEEPSKAVELRAKIQPVAGMIVNEEQSEEPTKTSNEVSRSTKRTTAKREKTGERRDEIVNDEEKQIEVQKVKQVFF